MERVLVVLNVVAVLVVVQGMVVLKCLAEGAEREWVECGKWKKRMSPGSGGRGPKS